MRQPSDGIVPDRRDLGLDGAGVTRQIGRELRNLAADQLTDRKQQGQEHSK